jgi:hypothetical protein
MPTFPQGAEVRYITLGKAHCWAKECLSKGIIRYGYESASPERFPLCVAGLWDDLRHSFLREGKSEGVATNFTNQTRKFFQDDGNIVWVAFVGDDLYWGRLEPTPTQPHEDGEGVYRRVDTGWSCVDRYGHLLNKVELAESLTNLARFPGTSCRLDAGTAKYVIELINGSSA